MLREALIAWRDKELIEHIYPGLVMVSGSAILGDDVIDRIIAAGIQLDSPETFTQHVRWAYGFDLVTGEPNNHGRMLLRQLELIYKSVKATEKEDDQREANISSAIAPKQFYGGPSNSSDDEYRPQNRSRGRGRRGRARRRARGISRSADGEEKGQKR